MSIGTSRDEWGVPHLRAGDPLELAHAQGANAATDRAWQLEVERHRAQGSSAAFLGPGELDWDTFARQVRLADTARRCYDGLDADTAGWVRAYVAGVNSALAEGAATAPEFARVGLAPGRWEPWTPLAVWLTHHILFAGFPAKLWRDRAADLLGEEALAHFATDGPAASGSNGWLVTGEHTAAGAPLIAGDPHRYIEDPGVYQQIRLTCPEYDVIGLAVPGVPGIGHFGHTGSVAWAITNAMSDYQDLYRERLRRTGDGGVEALGPDGWRPAHAHTERIEVAGAPAAEIEVIETERGPVIINGELSLRYPPRVTGELGFEALPALLRARTVAELDAALDHWVEPVNVVLAADTAGGLLHRVAGRVPRRHRANLLRPVPAWLAEHAWTGWHHPLPRAEVRDHAVMANARGIATPLGVEFAAPHRADRIAELLAAGDKWSVQDMAAIHLDTRLGSAEPLLRLVAAQTGLTGAAAATRRRLLDWDRRMTADSVAAGRYAALRSAVVRGIAALPVLAPLTEPSGLPALFAPWLSLTARVGLGLEHLLVPGRLPGLDPAAVVRAALQQVAEEPDRAWGETHRLAPWRALPDPGWAEPALDGDHDCVLATSSHPGVTDRCLRASAARYVWDLADRTRSRWVVPFGAGGPDHRYDQLPHWLDGRLLPVGTETEPGP